MHASNEEEHIGTEQQYLPNGCPANEKFSQCLIQCAPNAILFLSPDHLILEFNPEAERLYGRKREDVLGKDYFEEFLSDDAREAVAADIEKVLADEPTRRFENVVIAQDGQERILSWNVDRVLDSDDKCAGVVAIGQDITEHKQSDSALNESLQTSDDIFRTIPSGLFIYRYQAPDSLFMLYGNPEAERLTGIKVTDWLGKEFNEIWPEAKERGITEAFLSPMKTGQMHETEDLYYKDERLEGAFRIRAFQLPGQKLAVAFENINKRKQVELSLKNSEEKYRSLIGNIPDVVWTADQNGNTTFISQNVETICGCNPEEVYAGRNHFWFGKIHPDDVERVTDAEARLFGEGTPLDVEYRMQKKNGEWIWLQDRSTGTYEKDGVKCADGVFSDITEQKKAEQALLESEEKYRQLFETEMDAIMIFDAETREFLDVNDAAVHLYGYSREEFLNLIQTDITLEEEASDTSIKQTATGQPERIPLRYHKKKDGTVFPVEISGSSFELNGRKVICGVIRDITERKQAQEELRRSEQMFRTYFELGLVGMAVTSPEKGWLYVNDNLCKMLGYSRDELKQTTWADLTHPDDLETDVSQFERVREGKINSYSMDKRFIRKDGKIVHTRLSVSCVRREDGSVEHFIAHLDDITDRIKAEEAVHQSEEKYRTLFESANDAIFILEASDNHLHFNECNSHVLDMFGCRREDIIGKSPVDFSPSIQPDGTMSKERAPELCAAAMAGEPQHFEWKHCQLDGTEFDVEVTLNRLDIAGETCLQAIVRDITDRKKAEKLLLESENRYRNVVENAGEGIAVVQDGTLQFINPHLTEIMGYSEKECLSHPFIEYVHPDDRDWAMGIHKKRLEGEEVPHVYEFRAVDKQGNTIWLENNGILIDWKGKSASLNFLRDITDRKQAEQALREERDRAQHYLDVAGVMFVNIDAEGKVTLINKKGCDILGYQEEEIVGKSWFDNFLPAKDRETVKEVFFKLIAGEIEPVEYYENPILTKDGEERIIAWHNTILQEEGGKIIGTLSSGEDVTERKKAEVALAESEQRFRKFFENEPEYCYMVSPQGTILEANRAVLNTLGYTTEELVGKPLVIIYAPESKERMHQFITQWEETGEIRDEEMVILSKNGEKRTVLLSAAQVLDEDGKLLHSVSIQRDITERKEAEQKLKSSEERFKALFEYAPDAYYMTDLQGKFVDGNRAAEQTIGYKKEELIGKSFLKLKLLSPGQIPKAATLLAKNALGQPTGPDEFVLNRKDGTKVDLEIRTYPIQLNCQTLVLGIARDITERKKAEEALREERDKLKALMDGINRAGIGIDIIGADYKVLFQNQTLEDRFGKLSGKPCYEHYMAQEKSCDRCAVTEAIQQNTTVEIEQRGHDGRDYQIFTAPVPEADGSVSKAIEIVLDITERKRTEAERTRLTDILETTSDFVSTATPDGELTYLNRAGKGMLGWPEDESCDGRGISDIHPDWAFHIINNEAIPAAIERGICEGETAMLRSDGTEIPVSQVIMAHKAPDGQVEYLSTIIRDITERKQAEEALRESEERFRLAVSQIPGTVWTIDTELKFALSLGAGLPALGLKPGQVVGMSLFEFFGTDDPDYHSIAMHYRALQGESVTYDDEFEGKYYQTYIEPLRNLERDITGVIGISFDVTDRKLAEIGMRDSEEKLRSILESSPDAITVTDLEGHIINWNAATMEIHGFSSAEELINFSAFDLIAPQDREKAVQNLSRTLEEGVIRDIEYTLRKADGSDFPGELSASVIHDASGQPTAFVAVTKDITERKRAEEAMKKSSIIIDSTTDAVITTDIVGNITFWNKGAEIMYDYRKEEAIGKPVSIIYKDEDLHVLNSMIADLLEEKDIPGMELTCIDKNGQDVEILLSLTTIRDKDGNITELVGITKDITKRKRLEEAYRSLVDNSIQGLAIIQDGRIVFLNKSFSSTTGYSEEDMLTASPELIRSCVHPEDREMVWARNRDRLAGKPVPPRYEFRWIRKDGSTCWLEIYVSKIEYQGCPAVQAAYVEITDRKLAEEKLRESEERLTKAFRASPNLMGIVDLDERRRLLVNDAITRITGYSIEEVIGTTSDELNFWVEPDRIHEAFRLVRQDGVLQDYETDIRTKEGEIRTLRYHGALLDIHGNDLAVFSAEDITEQREAEKKIKEYQTQLKSLASELSLAEERERRRIAVGIHDDIAQKLAMAKFGLQSLQASISDSELSGSLEKQCQLMDQIVADARSLTFELSNPVLYQVGLEAAVESYLTKRIQGQFGIKCKFTSEGPRSSLEENIRVVLFQAVRELLANVIKHANASTVEVDISNTKDKLRIVVKDDGVGFDPTEIGPHLVGRGGFGLFNIRERLEYLGGTVKIESMRKKGTRVTMTVAIRTNGVAGHKEMLP